MSFFEFDGKLYEFTTISPWASSDWMVECIELSNPRGYFGTIVVSADGTKATLRTEEGDIPLAVLRYWLSLLPELSGVPESGE